MSYTKTITVYSKQERRNLQARGIWIDKDGNQIPVRSMNYDRLDKLIRMLTTWAMNDNGDVYNNLRAMSIFPYVVIRIQELGMRTFQASMFLDAYKNQSIPHTQSPRPWWTIFS